MRLYTKETFRSLPLDAKPEILRCNLAPVVLQLKAAGVDDILGFDFLDPPERSSCKIFFWPGNPLFFFPFFHHDALNSSCLLSWCSMSCLGAVVCPGSTGWERAFDI